MTCGAACEGPWADCLQPQQGAPAHVPRGLDCTVLIPLVA